LTEDKRREAQDECESTRMNFSHREISSMG